MFPIGALTRKAERAELLATKLTDCYICDLSKQAPDAFQKVVEKNIPEDLIGRAICIGFFEVFRLSLLLKMGIGFDQST